MSDQVRLAVIGTGWWASYAHIPGLLAHPAAQLVALCDQDQAKAELTAAAFGIDRTYGSVETMLDQEQLDGVVVATNHASHYQVAKPCLQRGIDVLIEKPMTLFAVQARELVQIAGDNQCQISIGYNANYTPYAQRARQLLQSGALGPVQYISGIFNQHIIRFLSGDEVIPPGFENKVHSPGQVYSDPRLSGGGHGHLQITHLAGLLFYLTGLRARSVSARMHQQGLNVDLVNAINVEFASGALAALGGTGNMPGGRKIDLQVYCQHGWVDIDDVAGTAVIHGDQIEREQFAPAAPDQPATSPYASTHNLVERILGKAENGAPGEVGWCAVELLEAAYRSAAASGRPVAIKELYREEAP